MGGGRRLPRPAVLVVAVTVALAGAASAAYEVARVSSPHEHAAAERPAALALRASVAPERVAYGGSVRVEGVVRDASGAPVRGRTVEVVAARVDAPDAVAVVSTPVTDAAGRVRASFRPAAGSEVWLRYADVPGVAAANSEPVTVAVAQRVTVTASTKAVRGRWVTTFRGVVTPGRAGQPVRLDLRDARGWRTEAVGTLTSASGYTFTVQHDRPGTYAYRVVRPADAAFDAGTVSYDLRVTAPPKPVPALPTPRVTGTGGAGRLLVTGDSLAYYLGQQLATLRRAKPTVVESRPSSGLARPDYFDWTAYAHQQVASRPGAVVAFVGANDCQPIRIGGTGAWTSVGTPQWAAEYQRRAAGLMRAYAGDGARPVYWIGLPIAREAHIAACYRTMNAATTAAARGVRGVRWVESWDLYAVDGRYADRVQGVVARQEDGIHLTFAGTRFLTRRVYGLLGR